MIVYIVCSIVPVVSFALLLFWYYRKYYLYGSVKNVANPWAIPFIGHAPEFLDISTMIENAMKLVEKHGNRASFMIGFDPYLFVGDNVLTAKVLNSPAFNTKDETYDLFKNWLGTGLLTSCGEKYHTRRKLTTPAFHFQVLNNHLQVFDKAGDTLIEKLRADSDKSIDVIEFIGLYTLDTICETAFGKQMNAQINKNTEYAEAIQSMLNVLIRRKMSIVKNFNLTYMLTADYWLERKLVKFLHNKTNQIIRDRRAELSNSAIPEQKLSFLDILLRSSVDGELLSDDDIREEVDTFMFGGHHTTASSICFTLYCIAQHPEVQENISKELEDIYNGDQIRRTVNDDLGKMNYLEMVIKESLRLYAPVPMFGRILHEKVVVGDDVFQPGTRFVISQYAIARNADYFPEPLRFIPERFSPENINKLKPGTYFPFSAGPRNCIGQKYAMKQIKCIVSKILRNFILLPDPNHELKLIYEVILKSSTGIRIQFQER